MIDPFDFKEPSCVLCGGKEFYNPKENDAKGRIPVKRIIEKVDESFSKNDYSEAGRLLEYWKSEAIELSDKEGELAIDNELVGFYRKQNNVEKGLDNIERTLFLIEELKISNMLSTATIFLNIGTAYKVYKKFDLSVSFFDKALDIYNKNLDKNDKMFAGLYNNYALSLEDLNKNDEAENYYRTAIKILSNYEDCKLDMAISYINLAHLLDRQNKNAEIVDLLFNAYHLLTDESIEENGYTAFVYSKCYPSFSYFGYDIIAKELKEKSEKIYERN